MGFKIKEGTRKFKVCVCGLPGKGKSTLASKAPGVGFIDLEDGIPHLKGVLSCQPKTFTEFMVELGDAEKSDMETIVIDSLTYLEKIITADVCATRSPPVQNIGDIPHGAGYAKMAAMFNKVLDKIDQISKTKNVICIAHSKMLKVEDPLYGEYDETGIALSNSLQPLACAALDAIFHIKEDILVDKESGAITLTNKFYIYTQPVKGVVAKSRFNLPPKIERNSFDWKNVKFN